MIELKSISGSCFGGEVRDVSFRLPNGKTYGVFSSCYSDAVCLLAFMSGTRTPSGGSVLAGGFDLHREAKAARRAYEEAYGPLTLSSAGGDHCFGWNKSPLPWEWEAN